ncbi:hypothetical protein COLO4_25142 [Corchorus olitorius]|uniref:diacylglycerol O-acyltransferase n=1 Tax=Corchorus olitorius TaxID=93759 RepID=A0A1R3I4S3_9ROSI|nr:hypothetical protein COLO4_25142 [Corchorus olitorius]
MEHAAGDFVSKKLEGEDLGLKQIKVKGGIEEEEGEPLSPMAQMFQEPESNVYIILSVGFKSPIDPFSFKTNLLHTLLNNHPRFSSVQVADEKNGGELKWVQTKVELENHVIIVPMDEGDDMEPKAADKFVEDYISNLTKTNLSMSNYSKNIPMWDCHILNLKTSDEAKSHVVMRVHHSLGDGTSLMSLLLSFSPKLSDPLSFPTFPAPTKKPIPSPTSTLFGACIKIWSIFLLFWNTLVDVLMCVATTYFLKDTQTPLKAPSSAVAFTSRRIVRRTFSLADVKFVKNALIN